jgi:putative transcriptional regulator
MVWQDGDMSYAGRFLVATPLIQDPNFIHTVVYLYAHETGEGAAGVVLNRPSDEAVVDHLPDWRSTVAAPPVVFWGGPVATDSGLILLSRDGRIEPAEEMQPPEGSTRARIFVGQAGWGPGQLEMEMAEGAWLAVDADADDVVAPFPEELWGVLLRRHGGQPALWATHPLDPSLN